jgi:hypothetical protein
MMLATWLIEICLSRCNELEDIVAAESVSQDVENLRYSRTVVEEELRQLLETYKVCRKSRRFHFIHLTEGPLIRRISILKQPTN